MHFDAPMQRTSKKAEQPDSKKATRITVSLPPDSYENLVRLAKSKKVSAAWVVRDAVDKYLTADIPLFAQSNT